MTEVRFPEVFDNSMRKDLVKCQKLAHWKHECGYQEKENEHLIAGGAFAAGLEIARKAFYAMNHTSEQAIQAGVQAVYDYLAYENFKAPAASTKSQARVAGAIAFYFEAYPLAHDKLKPALLDGKPAIECEFQFDTGIEHPITGAAIPYVGRFDMLVEDESGDLWVNDEKITGRLGDAWYMQWALDAQMTGYCWAANQMLEQLSDPRKVKGANIRGVSFLKDGYGTVQVQTLRQDWQIEVWHKQMLKDLTGWVDAFKRQNHNQILDHACALYNNPCSHSKLCLSTTPERLVNGNYEVRFWNPLKRS